MKHKILTKILSAFLSAIMLVSAFPLSALATSASTTANATATTPKKDLTPAETVEQEMAARATVTKPRETNVGNPYAVYVDGKLYKSGQFSEMWNLAMDMAAFVVEDETHYNDENRSENVEFVLYHDIYYTSAWFSEKTMTVSNRYFTIDLNGHILERYNEKGTVIKAVDNCVLTIMDSNPTKENAGNIGEYNLWKRNSRGSTKFKGGVITGGYLDSGDGGGIYIDGKSTVRLTGGTIAGNKAAYGSAVYVGGGSVLDMSVGTSQLCYNHCEGTSKDGGTVYLSGDGRLIGGYIHHNTVDNYGGAVRAKGNNIVIKDVVMLGNSAEYGGGFYTEHDWETGSTVSVAGCKIIGNYARKEGGAAYLYDLKLTMMSDCWVENNAADSKGGGVFISSFYGTDLMISGKMIIRNNHEAKNVRSNLYIAGDDDLIVDTLDYSSEVWIKTGSDANSYNGPSHSFLDRETSTSQYMFFSDDSNYHVSYQQNPGKSNYRHLYLEFGFRNDEILRVLTDYSTKVQSTPYKVESGKYSGTEMPLYKGYFEYNLMTTSDFYSASPFYYSDGYFLEDPTVYNTHLATMSINAAVAAFGRSTTHLGDNTYANHFANVKQLFADIGCADVNFFANEDYQMKPTYFGEEGRLSTIGVAISQKKIKVNNETYTLVPVAIRGGSYEVEWASNVTIGDKGEAKGFSDAANQVYGHIQNYIQNYGLTEEVTNGKVKFWVVGYSRAGATANLTSKRLVDNYASVGNQVYGYTFEAPMGGIPSEIQEKDYTGNGTYPTIHNTINELDFVTLVAPSEMGFIRYGVDHLVGSTEHEKGISYKEDSAYYQQRTKMLAQLNAINPYYKFDDSWELADINVVLGSIPVIGTDYVDKGVQIWDDPNPECENMYTLLRWFFFMVQGDGLDLDMVEVVNSNDGSKQWIRNVTGDSRSSYANKRPLAKATGLAQSSMSVQEAVAALMTLVMSSLSDEQMSQLISAAMANGLGIKDYLTDFHFWDSYYVDRIGGWQMAFIMPIVKDIKKLVDFYSDVIDDWDTHSDEKKFEVLNMLMGRLIGNRNGSVGSILNDEQWEIISNAVPVVLWFVLNYAACDYNTVRGVFDDDDDGMWGVGTFVNNMSSIISNHYQEVSVAWVRSYDKYYENDLQAYRLDTEKVSFNDTVGVYKRSTQTLTLKGQEGSSIYYSIDGGETWTLYTDSVSFYLEPKSILCFSIYRGVKSIVKEVSLKGWAGTIIGNGNIWFLIVGSAFVVGFSVVGIEISRKKKREALAEGVSKVVSETSEE